MELHQLRGDLTPVQFFKERLGRQNTCLVCGSGNRRQYVWFNEHWLIYVHNVGGVQFCVVLPCDDPTAIWKDFYTTTKGGVL